ncbi:MAG: YggT family protein [Candidatus Poribacteria bacterium]|nr:YggT family protein [Candidatus Poribacteria bacterium]MDE0313508.1 YggT family protein [Candidatus Poribacteria bacterium]
MDLLAYIISRLLRIYMLIVFVNVFLSWIVFGTQNLTVRGIYRLTSQIVEPVLQPIRNVLQPMSRNIGIDFSPMVLLFLLYILTSIL